MNSCNVLTEKQAADHLKIELDILIFLRFRNPELFFLNRDDDGEYLYCACCLDRDAEEIVELRDGLLENWGMPLVKEHVNGMLNRAA